MTKIPSSYTRMRREQPEMLSAYETFGAACAEAGPLDGGAVALLKLAISCGAGLEGGVRSHARKALEAGRKADELLHVAHLCAPTIGFPGMMRARKWILEVIDQDGGS